jgi:outer membrane protein assembly factor BamA
VLKYSTTTLNAGTLVDSVHPYGVAHFLQYGSAVEFRLDTRDRPRAATRGIVLGVGGNWYPAAADVQASFGEVHGEAVTYLTAPVALEPTLALRGGGKKVWGTYPFHEAAYIGGATTVRGFAEHRFAGDAALYGNAELRVRLARVFVLLPEVVGVFGLADAGRVYLAGEPSDRWHTGVGGGAWLSFLQPANTLSIAWAHSVEGARIYVNAGFAF